MVSARVIQIAKALSDPQRVAILSRIARQREVPCKTLVEEFHITPATISHHIKELVEADLVTVRREGKCAYFTLKGETMAAFQKDLKSLAAKRPSRAKPQSDTPGPVKASPGRGRRAAAAADGKLC